MQRQLPGINYTGRNPAQARLSYPYLRTCGRTSNGYRPPRLSPSDHEADACSPPAVARCEGLALLMHSIQPFHH
jgi:hypothetical protein